MKKIRLLSQLLVTMMAIAVFGTSCNSDDDDLNAVMTYTVTFQTNGGTEIEAVKTVDGKINEPETPTMGGATFDGWYVDSEFETKFDFDMFIVGNITLYAKWNTISYTIYYYSSTDGDYTTLADEMLYTKYTVGHNTNVTNDATDPETTAQYSFEGWFDNKECTGDEYAFGSAATGDVTLYAKWTVNSYTVTFDLAGGSSTGDLTVTVEYGKTITALDPEPTYTGYEFIGWYTDEDGDGTKWIFNEMEVTEATTLYAYWAVDVIGTAYFYNGVYATAFEDYSDVSTATQEDKIVSGSTLSAPTTGVENTDKYSFIGWFTEETFEEGEAYAFTDVLTEDGDVSLYAKWEINTYTVTIEMNGGTFASDPSGFEKDDEGNYSVTAEYGTTVTEPADPTKTDGEDNIEFLGWYIDGVYNDDNIFQFGETEIVGDTEVQAIWKEKLGTVSFYNSIGNTELSSYDKSTDLVSSESIFMSDIITKEEVTPDSEGKYEFVGWFTEAGFSGETSFDFETPIAAEGDIELYAKWTGKEYTVTFETGDGSEIDAIPVAYGEVIPAQISTLTGYSVEGWYTEPEGAGEQYILGTSTMPVGNLTLYANWEIETYVITVNLDGGSLEDFNDDNTFEVEYNNLIGGFGTPSKDGALFLGWYYNSSLYDFETPVTSEMTITAMWKTVEAGAYIITSEADLQAFRTAVNDECDTTAIAYLANDIYLTEEDWTPIGTGLSTWTGFAGTFDGNNKTIYGLTINSELGHRGLFGALSPGATIKDCTISGLNIVTTGYFNYGSIGAFAGGIAYTDSNAGYIYLDNLTVKDGIITGPAVMGGIIGSTTRYSSTGGGMIGIFTDCTIESDVTITKESDTYNYTYVGGIAGTARNASTFTNCHNKGTINATSGSVVAGIVAGGIANTFINCSNSGNINSTVEDVGGIMGFNGATSCSFIGCYNTGTITSSSHTVGGIIGQLQNVSKFYACYNTGEIIITGDGSAGNIVGEVGTGTYVINTTFADCYYVANDLPAFGAENKTITDQTGITEVSSIANLNAAVSTMNANSTFSATDYMYQAGNDTTPPSIVAR